MYKNTRAFTIIELLVVIIVIAILATVSIVVYGGVQKRANSAAYAAAADGAEKQLRVALAGDMTILDIPALASGATMTCLGRVSDYPETADFAAGECEKTANGTHSNSVNPDMAQALDAIDFSISKSLPTVRLNVGGQAFLTRGLVFGRPSNAYSPDAYRIQWMAPDASACGRAEKVSLGSDGVVLCFLDWRK